MVKIWETKFCLKKYFIKGSRKSKELWKIGVEEFSEEETKCDKIILEFVGFEKYELTFPNKRGKGEEESEGVSGFDSSFLMKGRNDKFIDIANIVQFYVKCLEFSL